MTIRRFVIYWDTNDPGNKGWAYSAWIGNNHDEYDSSGPLDDRKRAPAKLEPLRQELARLFYPNYPRRARNDKNWKPLIDNFGWEFKC